ncbi:MAG: TrbG/VirB9 family P-type conjugative transfer protein [Burkholderiaceae bacterium]|jgi:type IV secretion system protein VirB9|nr:TrbG/VirB9 family P-type conjugative transfer protein [Burkholderiaceae bacterium]
MKLCFQIAWAAALLAAGTGSAWAIGDAPPAADTPAVAASAPPAAPASGASAAVPVMAPASVPVAQQVPAPRVRVHRPPQINTISRAEIDQAQQLWERTGQAAGLIGDNGTVMAAYGETRPVIRCAPLHLCVIELLAGEQITDWSIGDSVRWKAAASRAGDTPVVVIKPVAAGLETNLTVLTDQGRVYYMTLTSTRSNYVPLVQFYNPQDLIERNNRRLTSLHAQAQAVQESKDATLGKLDPATLDFGYACTGEGETSFKPVRVFSGNGHVYLQMPDDMQYRDAPAVFDESHNTTQLINSRMVRGYTILDGLPDKFKLVVGVQSVTCAHGEVKPDRAISKGRWNGTDPTMVGG